MKLDGRESFLSAVVPGGAHTYSRGRDQFPSTAPPLLVRGKGSKVYDSVGRELLDYGMALRAVTLGYANARVDAGALRGISLGTNLTLPSYLEFEAAEKLLARIPSADMVKFTKNGSTANTAAVKLARAFTGRGGVCIPKNQPFFSFDDWFIGATPVNRGCLPGASQKTYFFEYGDLESLREVFNDHTNDISCVLMEAATHLGPCTCRYAKRAGNTCRDCPENQGNFLREVQALCRDTGSLFILDEVITGFRWHEHGAQYYFNVDPDLSTFGKALGNGYAVAALAGKREVMALAGLEPAGSERVFLLSTTNGAEMSSLGAMLGVLECYEESDVCSRLWKYGGDFVSMFSDVTKDAGLTSEVRVLGEPVSPIIEIRDTNGEVSLPLKTLFMQEMLRHGVLIPWVAFSTSHTASDLEWTASALAKTLRVLSAALEDGVDKFLMGTVVKPVFRKYN